MAAKEHFGMRHFGEGSSISKEDAEQSELALRPARRQLASSQSLVGGFASPRTMP
jgi:hypothetical protein